MPLTQAEIETSYRLALERMPSANEIASIGSQHSTLNALRQILLNSEEFQRKFTRLRTDFENRQVPILVHVDIPEATAPAILSALDASESLQPGRSVDAEDFAEICARPRPERLQIRSISGDIPVDAGRDLNLPWRRLLSLRNPGERIFAIYRDACAAEGRKDLTFGTYLEYSVQSERHRVELDNGQLRRLAGRADPASLGQEAALLRPALHAAMDPITILGLYEQPAALISALAADGFIEGAGSAPKHDTKDDGFGVALKGLTPDQRQIFEAYVAWDTYLYDVIAALVAPATV